MEIVKCNVKQLTDLLKILLKKPGNHVIIWGFTGIGKTEIVEALAKEEKRTFIPLIASSMEPTDLTGAPVPSKEEVKFLKTDLLSRIEKARKPIIFLDEFNRAPRDVQNALLQLTNKVPYIGPFRVKQKHLNVILCLNDAEEEENIFTTELDKALRTRCAEIRLVPEKEEVVEHLSKKYPNNIVLEFIRTNRKIPSALEEILRKYPFPPRIWEKLAQSVESLDPIEDREKLLLLFQSFAKSNTLVLEFSQFLEKFKRISRLLFIQQLLTPRELRTIRKDQSFFNQAVEGIPYVFQELEELEKKIEEAKKKNPDLYKKHVLQMHSYVDTFEKNLLLLKKEIPELAKYISMRIVENPSISFILNNYSKRSQFFNQLLLYLSEEMEGN